MAIFGRKKSKKKEEKQFSPPADVENVTIPEVNEVGFQEPVLEEPRRMVETVEEPQPTFAPLFVKLNRYKQILNTMNTLKMNVSLIKNQLAILAELNRLRDENMRLLNSAINKINDKLINLDSEFMRPSGFMDEMPEMQMQDVESLENTITDLTAQIEHLKSEMEAIA